MIAPFRRVINSASLSLDDLKLVGQAFDEAWLAISGNYIAGLVEDARMRLAGVLLLLVATEANRDVEALKIAALERLGKSMG
jgi:hypothetical protein